MKELDKPLLNHQVSTTSATFVPVQEETRDGGSCRLSRSEKYPS